jgi:hypothetical protein
MAGISSCNNISMRYRLMHNECHKQNKQTKVELIVFTILATFEVCFC